MERSVVRLVLRLLNNFSSLGLVYTTRREAPIDEPSEREETVHRLESSVAAAARTDQLRYECAATLNFTIFSDAQLLPQGQAESVVDERRGALRQEPYHEDEAGDALRQADPADPADPAAFRLIFKRWCEKLQKSV